MKTRNQYAALIAELLASGDFESAESETVECAEKFDIEYKVVESAAVHKFNITYCDDCDAA